MGNNAEDGGVAIKHPIVPSVEAGLQAPAPGNAGPLASNHFSKAGNGGWRPGDGYNGRQNSFSPDDAFSPFDGSEHHLTGRGSSKQEKQHIPRNDQRTVLMTNLPERATHKDIAGVIRGGALLDIYLRTSDRIASISFVDGTSAQDFTNYAKRNDIYIYGKRVRGRQCHGLTDS